MPTEPPTAQRAKEQQLKHWNGVAPGWAAWLDWTEENFHPLTEWMAVAAGWRPGARILDVASGAGYPALAASRLIQPGGTVIACDLSPAMTDLAARAAAARGAYNLEFRTMDAEALALADASVDAVTNAYGLMFCPDPLRAVQEARRVLVAGGRAAVVTWDEPSKSPFFNVITPLAAPYLGIAPPEAGAPGPFRLSSPDELSGLLCRAGFADVSVQSLPMVFRCESPEQYCQMFGDLAWKARMASLDGVKRAALLEEVRSVANDHLIDGRLHLTAISLCACGRAR
jgi:ubiquinone/menaquinone biosynthesis C-methylase UbiE